jgi:hypothetical protein
MQGADVYGVLKQIGTTHLHHANSVATSCTLLEQGGLLSRGFVQTHGLTQTEQSSDQIDQKYDIWDRIFVDHVDIHDRGGRRKGPNQYGPVLSQFDLDILLRLPAGSEVFVTKKNPVHWYDSQPDSERWFQSAEELRKDIHFGDFDKMLVIKTPSGKVDFPNDRVRIILDDPQRPLSSGEDAYTYAMNRVTTAAAVGGVEVSIERRECRSGCICVEKYAKYPPQTLDFWFT